RKRPHPEQAVLAVEPDRRLLRQVVGHFGGQADAEVHDRPRGDLPGRTLGHLRFAPRHLDQLPRARVVLYSKGSSCSRTSSTWCTKSPGRCTSCGSIAPSSTSSSASTIVVCAAVAMMGEKLRAVRQKTQLPKGSARRQRMSAKSASSASSSRKVRPLKTRVSLPSATTVPPPVGV